MMTFSQKQAFRAFAWMILLSALATFSAQAQPPAISGKPVDFRHPELDESFAAYEIVQFDYQRLYELSQDNQGRFLVVLSLSQNHEWSLTLDYHDLRAANYREVALTENGPRVLPRRPNITYRGYADADRKTARFTITPDYALGMIHDEEDTYFLEPLQKIVEDAPRDYYLLYNTKDVVSDPAVHCAFNTGKKYQAPPKEEPVYGNKMACMEVEFATAGDFLMFDKYGSVAAVNDFIISITNLMEPLYDDFNLDYLIVDQFVPTSALADPWTTSDEAFDILDDFSTWAPVNMNTHDLGQIWTDRNIQGCGGGPDNFGLVGCAQAIGDVCGAERYNVCEDYSNSTNCLRVLSAHECGHNWDGVHGQSDGSSIMTPTIQCASTYWAAGNITRLQDHIDSRGCLSSCGTDCTIGVGVVISDEGCPGANDGSASAIISGENPPVTYTLSGPVNATNGTGQFTNLPPGNYTLRATDGAFNETCWDEVDFTIDPGVDNTDPNLVCQNAIVKLDNNGNGSIVAANVVNLGASSDNCGTLILGTPSPNSFDCGDLGNNIVTVSASDGNGNSDMCNATVTVVDEIKPSITCQADFGQNNDPGDCGAVVTLLPPTATDNCTVTYLRARTRPVDPMTNTPIGAWTSFTVNPSGFYAVGKYQVQWRARDQSNNARNCSFFFEVIDNEPPVAVCMDHTIDFNGEEEIVLQAADIWNEAASSDNCGPVFFVGAVPPEIPCEDLGDIIPVTVTIEDQYGNTDDCISQVTVDGLPCGWMTWPDHIDCPGSSADYEVPTETFILNSNQCYHPNFSNSDDYAYVKTELCGDGEIIAQVTSITGGTGWAGIVMRESNASGSKKFQLMTGLNLLPHRTDWRSTTNGASGTQNFFRFGQHWLRITRQGPIFRAYTSYTGMPGSWGVPVFTQYINMNNCLEAGLVVTNSFGGSSASATFNNVFVTPPAPPRPGPPDVSIADRRNDAQLHLFPNPTRDHLTVQLTPFQEKEAQLEVINLYGQRMLQRDLGRINQANERLDVSGLPAGIYYLRLRLADGSSEQVQFVKQ